MTGCFDVRALTVTGPRQLDWRDIAVPTLASPAAALVRPIALAACDFDHLLVGGVAPIGYPTAIGHEMVAEVIEVGANVAGVAAGDRVVVPFQISCGQCGHCRTGMSSSCEAVPWLSCYGLGSAAGDWGAGSADLVGVPYADAMLIPLPAGIPAEIAAAAGCNLTDAYRCVVPQLRADPTASVLVVANAFQNIGLSCVAFARALGAERVDVFGLAPGLAAKAHSLGANLLAAPADARPQSYGITVDASLDGELLRTAIRATAPGGVCTVSAMYPQELTPVPLLEMFAACVTLHAGQPHVRSLLPEVLSLLADDRVDTASLIDDVHPWDDAIAAFTTPGKHVIARTA